jgi:hypothetical protein
MKKNVLLAVIILLSRQLLAQDAQLLKQFKYRINHFRALNVNGGIAGQQFSQQLTTEKINNRFGNISIAGNYYTLHSTDTKLNTAAYGLSASYGSSFGSNNSSNNNSYAYTLLPQVSFLNRWFNKKNNFVEVGIDADGNRNYSRQKINTATDPSLNSFSSYGIGINLGIGTGRLENITDMQNALWLVRALTAENYLKRQLNNEELLQLGRSITRANNTRILDFRKRIQFVLETTDSFFKQTDVLSKTDIGYFSNLNDIVFFAFNNQRLAGTEKFIRLSSGINERRNTSTNNNFINKSQLNNEDQNAILTIGFNKNLPKSLVTQVNFGAAVKLHYRSAKNTSRNFISGSLNSEQKTENDRKAAGLRAFYEYALYPNTRTNITLALQAESGVQEVNRQSDFFTDASLTANCSYFINYNTRFTASFGSIFLHNIYNQQMQAIMQNQSFRLFANAGVEFNF